MPPTSPELFEKVSTKVPVLEPTGAQAVDGRGSFVHVQTCWWIEPHLASVFRLDFVRVKSQNCGSRDASPKRSAFHSTH